MIRALELLGHIHRSVDMGPPTVHRPATPSTPTKSSRSPYWTPPRSGMITRSRSRSIVYPPTPESPLSVEIPVKAKRKRGTAKCALPRKARIKPAKSDAYKEGHDPHATDSGDAIVTTSETGTIETIDKIHLIQERVRHDPWKMLVATCLLNKTSGRAARPIYIELLRRYPDPIALSQASVMDLSDLLYPLGLFNQRALSLIRFSTQYLHESWPIHQGTDSPDPFLHPTCPIRPLPSKPTDMDVTIFHGAGVYASDSFRIYSDLFPGGGAPAAEAAWVEKRKRAMDRMNHVRLPVERVVGVEEAGEYMSDAEVEEDDGAEWRRVRPNDKELRRYLIWRWGLEGITYDIHKGPLIRRDRDRKRLAYLL